MVTEVDKKLASMMQKRRKEMKLSQEKLAYRSGVSRITVALLETKKQKFTLSAAIRIAATLDISIDNLI